MTGQPGLSIAASADEQLRPVTEAASHVQSVTTGASEVHGSPWAKRAYCPLTRLEALGLALVTLLLLSREQLVAGGAVLLDHVLADAPTG